MTKLPVQLTRLTFMSGAGHKNDLLDEIRNEIKTSGYTIVDEDVSKPWGGFFRMASKQADGFIDDFFPGLDANQARLGVKGAELSPKILVVLAGERLSWQYHNRRAERWQFITDGGYRKSIEDNQSSRHIALRGETIQFQKNERHRLEASPKGVTLVAEIWQHSEADYPSDEEDIVRLEDDYTR